MSTLSDLRNTSSILLDTNIIFSLITDSPNTRKIEDEVRIASLTTENLIIPPSTMTEINYFLRKNTESHTTKIYDIKRLNRILESKCVHIMDEDTKIDFDQQKGRLEKIFSELSNISPANGRRLSNYMDAQLILTSEYLRVPILTADNDIKKFAKVSLPDLSIPLPFDLNVLSSVSLDELMELTIPMKKIFIESFNSLKDQMAVIEKQSKQAEGMERIIDIDKKISENQERMIQLLGEQVKQLGESESFWKEAAKPSATTAVSWTIAECSLSFLPFHIPTAPVAYFVDVHKHKKLEKEAEKKFGKKEN